MTSSIINAFFGGGGFILPFLARKLFGSTDKVTLEILSLLKLHQESERKASQENLEAIKEDKKYARALIAKKDRSSIKGSFLGRTRRRLALTFPLYLFLILLMSTLLPFFGVDVPIVMPYKATTSFLGLIYTSHYEVLTLHGMLWTPWMQQLFFSVFGFYFGFETVKHV